VSNRPKEAIVRATNIQFTSKLDRYVGFKIFQESRGNFSSLIERLNGKLLSWKSNLLNNARRITLVCL